MGRKANQLTIQQHHEIGRELHEMRAYLVTLSVTIYNSYSHEKAHKLLSCLGKVKCQLDDLRYEFDDQLYNEHPDEKTRMRPY